MKIILSYQNLKYSAICISLSLERRDIVFTRGEHRRVRETQRYLDLHVTLFPLSKFFHCCSMIIDRTNLLVSYYFLLITMILTYLSRAVSKSNLWIKCKKKTTPPSCAASSALHGPRHHLMKRSCHLAVRAPT